MDFPEMFLRFWWFPMAETGRLMKLLATIGLLSLRCLLYLAGKYNSKVPRQCQMLHVRYMYLHSWVIWGSVGQYSIHPTFGLYVCIITIIYLSNYKYLYAYTYKLLILIEYYWFYKMILILIAVFFVESRLLGPVAIGSTFDGGGQVSFTCRALRELRRFVCARCVPGNETVNEALRRCGIVALSWATYIYIYTHMYIM